MLRPMLAKMFYYTGFQMKADKEKFNKLYKMLRNVDIEMEAGNVHNVYFQLMMINVLISTTVISCIKPIEEAER